MKKITNKRCNEILDFLRESHFPNFSRIDDFTLAKRNGTILSCLTIDANRDRTNFQIVRHFHYLMSDVDSIRLSLAYRVTKERVYTSHY